MNMNNKLEELMATAKLNELLHKNKIEEEKKSNIVTVLAVIGAIAAVAAIAFAVYKYLTPDYLEDFDEDFDDDFEDDFVEVPNPETEKKK